MVRQKNIITIDGPSGTGKSSVAKAVAEQVGYRYLDTGAMYRAFTLAVMENGVTVDPPDENEIGKMIEEKCLALDPDGRVLLYGKMIDERIRSDEVTRNVSAVAALTPVRTYLVGLQRQFGERTDVVAEGRDLGSVVYPDAAYKFYLDASPEERARRRANQIANKQSATRTDADETNDSNTASEEKILADQERRDRIDSSRTCSPLVETEEMIRIDTTNISRQEVQALILKYIQDN